MKPILALIATAESHGDAEREQYIAIPIADLNFIKPLIVTVWPVRVKNGEAKLMTRNARRLGTGWLSVDGILGCDAGYMLEAVFDGETLFINRLEQSARKRASYSSIHIKLPTETT